MKIKRILSLWMLLVGSAQGSSWSDLWYRQDQQAQQALEAKDPKRAAELFTDPRRQAYAQLQAEQNAAAAKRLEPFGDAGSQYNRGNALAKSGDLQGALIAYDGALKHTDLESSLRRDAQHNRDLVAKELKSQKQQQQQQQQQQQTQQQQQQQQQQQSSSGQQSPSTSTDTGKPQGGESNASAQNNSHDAQRQSGESREANKEQGASADSSQEMSAKQGANERRQEKSPGSVSQSGTGPLKSHAAAIGDASRPQTEQELALEQWLRQIPDDPGGLLRRKFMIEHLMKQQQVQP